MLQAFRELALFMKKHNLRISDYEIQIIARSSRAEHAFTQAVRAETDPLTPYIEAGFTTAVSSGKAHGIPFKITSLEEYSA